MTSVVQATDITAEPHRPWSRATQTLRESAISFAIAAALTSITLQFTGIAGGLGWYITFAVLLPFITGLTCIRSGKKLATDRLATVIITVLASIVALPWLSLAFTLVKRGSKAIYFGFFTQNMAFNSADDALDQGGIFHAITGTLTLVAIATLVAVPLGIVAAIYIVEVKGRLANLVRFFTQAMSGVPSIVAGLFIYATFVVQVFHEYNGMTGALALSILMLPTVARTTEEVLKVVPRDLRDASYALGATQFRTTMKIVLPTVRSGLITAALLGVARVAGETAPLLLTSQYLSRASTDLFHNPMASIPTYIFGNLTAGTSNAYSRAWGAALVLIFMVLLLSLTARLFTQRNKGKN